MTGGAGNDACFVDNISDQTIENPGEGNDIVSVDAGTASGPWAPVTTCVWNPGGGSDTVEGQAGADTLLATGRT